MTRIRLGLIGDNIRHSKSPLLHRLAGRLCGLDVSYDLLVPAECGVGFAELFDRCRDGGYRGVNVTYPYKELAFSMVRVDAPAIRRLGACNTVLFGAPPTGENTDYTGFCSAFRATFGRRAPGRVAMAGAGGVGKAIAFALADLAATWVSVFDPDRDKAERLVAALRSASGIEVRAAASIAEAMEGADGFVNCTPVGMVGHPGSAMPASLMGAIGGASGGGSGGKDDGTGGTTGGWAFDAVYTPLETEFLGAARRAGLEIMSGYELFFHQGVDAFRLFSGEAPERAALREMLLAPETAATTA